MFRMNTLLPSSYLEVHFSPEDGDSMFLQNIVTYKSARVYSPTDQHGRFQPILELMVW
jgi:hypothetical protein